MYTVLSEAFDNKAVPKVIAYTSCKSLYLALIKLYPGGNLCPTVLHNALMALHAEKPINFTHEDIDPWSAKMGSQIRIVLSSYRKLRVCEPVLKLLLAKASLATVLQIIERISREPIDQNLVQVITGHTQYMLSAS